MSQEYATRTTFLANVPGFDSVDTDLVDVALDVASCEISLECWGDKASKGHTYLTAHLLSVMTDTNGGGATKIRKKLDKLETQSAFMSSVSELDLTKWGRIYKMLLASLIILPVVGRC